MKRFFMITLLLALIVPATANAADVTLYDNMIGYDPQQWYAFTAVSWYFYNNYIEQQRVAQPFSTGDFSGTLSSLALLLNNYPGGSLSVHLYADDGGKPGGLLGDLSWISGLMGTTCERGYPSYNNCTFGKVTYGGNGISLAPNTTYWVVLTHQGGYYDYCVGQPQCGGEIFWMEFYDPAAPKALYSNDGGYNWKTLGNFIQSLQVYGTTGPGNLQPIANAGANGTAHLGSVVTLDGSGSSDPSGLSLTYSWSFASVPAGSGAALSDATAVSPTFTVDKEGDYTVRLVVTNSEGAASQPATVTISTYNTAPVADAGPDQAIVQVGTTVHLDGSQSYDADGDAVTYSWSFNSKPASSQATLTGDTTSTPTFVADVQGTYVIQLVVSDPWVASTPKTVTVGFDNVKPVANARTGQVATVGDLVTVDGSGSFDANFDPLTYQWSIPTMPPNSLATLANPTEVQATFVPDQPGTYGVQLIVNDGLVNSDPSTVQVQVTAVLDDPLLTLVRDEIRLIVSLDPLVFKNGNLQNSLIKKLQAVMRAIQSHGYQGALSNLRNDVMRKTDGCSVSGAPDKNDWIVTCEAQQEVYTNLMEIIRRIKELVAD